MQKDLLMNPSLKKILSLVVLAGLVGTSICGAHWRGGIGFGWGGGWGYHSGWRDSWGWGPSFYVEPAPLIIDNRTEGEKADDALRAERARAEREKIALERQQIREEARAASAKRKREAEEEARLARAKRKREAEERRQAKKRKRYTSENVYKKDVDEETKTKEKPEDTNTKLEETKTNETLS